MALPVVALLLAVVAASYLARRIRRPLDQTVRALQKVADGDLATRLEINTRDEMGQLATALNASMDRIRGAMQSFSASADRLQDSSRSLTSVSSAIMAGSNRTSEEADAVTASADEVSRSIEAVSAGAEQRARASGRSPATPPTPHRSPPGRCRARARRTPWWQSSATPARRSATC